MSKPGYGGGYREARRDLLARDPICVHCGGVATTADHQPPLALHAHVDGSGCCTLVPSCRPCAQKQSGALSHMVAAAKRIPVETVDEPDPIPVDDPVWDVEWLDDLREVPDSAVWPRWLTAPHPAAVGSYGTEVEHRSRVDLRWWQRLTARMLLQHDEAGALLFDSAIVSTRRQVGKTVFVRELAWWRLGSGEHFHDVQHVLHTARTLKPARDAISPVLMDMIGELRVSRGGGIWRIWWPDGSTWTAMAQKAAYGESASLALVDEAWDVKVASIDEGIEPTTAARESGQLALVSTAHRRCSSLMPGRRAEALEHLRDPGEGTMIVEWSAPREADIGDPAVWRDASPWWRPGDERKLRKIYERAISGLSADPTEPDPIEAFRSQWLNIWPLRALSATGRGDTFIAPEEWHALEIAPEPRLYSDAVIAMEDHGGLGVGAVRLSVQDDGRMVAEAATFHGRGPALDWLSARMVGVSMVLAGVTLAQDPALRSISFGLERRGISETAKALPLLRSMLRTNRVVHLPSAELDAQIADLRVRDHAGSLGIASRDRSDLVRCMAWAVQYVNDRAGVVPGVH